MGLFHWRSVEENNGREPSSQNYPSLRTVRSQLEGWISQVSSEDHRKRLTTALDDVMVAINSKEGVKMDHLCSLMTHADAVKASDMVLPMQAMQFHAAQNRKAKHVS